MATGHPSRRLAHPPRLRSVTRTILFTIVVALSWVETGSADGLPREIAPGIALVRQGEQAPPHTSLGVVYAHRWSRMGSDPPGWEILYDSVAERAKTLAADMVVQAVSGETDPLIQQGHVRWFLGIAARSNAKAGAALEPCDNCVVDWGPVDIRTGVTPDAELRALLERNAFAISRLRLGEMGYYLRDPAAIADTTSSLDLRLRVNCGIATPESLAFDASLVWEVSDVVVWGRSISATAPSSHFDPDGQVTRYALTDLYTSLPHRGRTPDSDGDTVPDSRDHEPETQEGVEVDMFGRSRDDDGDGVWNGIDREPNTARNTSVNQYGEADVDGDSVPDSIDECPDTSAQYLVDKRGCPDEEEITVVQRVVLEEGILRERLPFDPGSAKLKSASEARLNTIGMALSGLRDLRFKVDGHCDDRGSDELNDWLSKERAQVVVDYLVGRFPDLTPERFSINGYGKRIPITKGSDEKSRALNRRVEFIVENPEEAKRILRANRPRLRGGKPGPGPGGGGDRRN